MNEPKWVSQAVVEAAHSEVVSEHGGSNGLRDEMLLQSALMRPVQKFNYNPESSFYELAAAISFGIAKNHPFVDGNKRTALIAGMTFLDLNGFAIVATEIDATITFQNVASGEMSEEELVDWYRIHAAPSETIE
jgi:death on curing protein